jgi:hypothetical protein
VSNFIQTHLVGGPSLRNVRALRGADPAAYALPARSGSFFQNGEIPQFSHDLDIKRYRDVLGSVST